MKFRLRALPQSGSHTSPAPGSSINRRERAPAGALPRARFTSRPPARAKVSRARLVRIRAGFPLGHPSIESEEPFFRLRSESSSRAPTASSRESFSSRLAEAERPPSSTSIGEAFPFEPFSEIFLRALGEGEFGRSDSRRIGRQAREARSTVRIVAGRTNARPAANNYEQRPSSGPTLPIRPGGARSSPNPIAIRLREANPRT